MNKFLILNYKFNVAKPSEKSSVEKWLHLSQGVGLAVLALVKFSLVLVLYLSQDWEMIWLFYIYVLLDLPAKILSPPTPLLWVKYLVRIFLSKKKLWRYLMSMLLWDVTLLLLIGWMIMGIVFYPNYLEKLPFLLIAIVYSLQDSLLAFVLLMFSKKGNLAAFLAILVFVLALGAISMQENGLMLLSIFACLLVQWGLFTLLVKKEMFVI